MSGRSSEEPQLETNSNNSSFDKSNESFGRGRRRKRKVAKDSDGGDDDKSVDRSDDNSSVSSSIRRKRNENTDDTVPLDTETARGRGVVRLIRLKDPSSLLAACDIKEERNDDESMSFSENDTSTTNTEIPKEKKRRGRPPRNNSATSSHPKPKTKKKVVSKKVIDEVKSVSSSSSVGDKPSVPKKRGRGRPRKSDVVSTTPSVSTCENNFDNEKPNTSARRISIPSTSSGLESERKRRIIKPKRFDSYESFEFMDVNEKESASPNNSSRGNDDEEEGGDEDDDDEDDNENEKQDDENESSGVKPRRRRRRKPKAVLVARLDKEMVKCGVCQESMIMKDYKMKHMDKHNFLCWIEGDPPVDPKNENDIIAAVCKARRIKKKFFSGLKCPKCGARKKSGVGYYSHIQTCGMTMSEREATKIACPTCGRVMLPSSLKVHMTNEHKNLESKTIVNKEAELVEGVPLAKRAAASRAESKLEKFMADELDDIGVRVKKTIPLKRFYRQTQSKLFPNAHVRWKLELKEHNYVKCFIPGCSFTAHDLKEIRVHFYNCPFAVRVFICKLCDAQAKTDHDIQTHLLTSHKDSLTGDSDFQVKSVPESEDETEYNSLYFGLRESVVELPKPTAEKPSFILQSVHKRGLSFYADILDKTYKRVIANSTSQPLFQEFVAPFDDALTEIESEEFIPVASSSIRFSSEFGNWQKLGRFKSCTFGETKLLFTGGPIWAMAWCPVPLEETRQYLAVGCHPDMNMVHTQGSTHSYSSLIQIWDCGDLNNSNNGYLDNVPKLKLGLAHTNGAVWSLEWCPSGCYQPSCGRLGLLAAGFSNGKALIYSIPSRPTDVQRLPIFKFKPVLELELMSEEPAQCTRLAWTKDSPFNILACGYSDGLIALFDLTSQSPLLRSCNTLYPFHMFQPHSKSITGLQFIPRANSNFLLTASSDRDIKFWNLSDTSGPVSVSQLYRMITVTDVVWLNNWLCAASTYDDALGYGLMNISLNGYRDYMYGQPAPIMSQNSLHWSISFNDWTNGISTSSDAGEVVVMNFRHLYFVDDKKSKLRVKKYLTTTDLRKLDGNDTDPLLKLKAPESYDEAAEEYGLVLKCGTTVEYPSSKRDEPERHFYQIKSINKVTWNQNGRSFLFLAAGYQCGLVQIFRDHSVDEARVLFDDFYKKLLKAKRE